MKEIKDIIAAYEQASSEQTPVALATVVYVEGSAYRREGARMLIRETGELTGAISGGCLEGEALRKALWVMHQQKTLLVTFDSMDDEESTIGMGLGCQGIVHILIEPVLFSDTDNPVELLRRAVARRQDAVIVTLFSLADKRDVQPGTIILKMEDGMYYSKSYFPFASMLESDVAEALETKSSALKTFAGADYELTALIGYMAPPVSLVIAGAGNDIIPLVGMADILGWETTIVDGRPAYAKPERFTSACAVLNLEAAKLVENVPSDSRTIFLLMTHNYHYDLAVLEGLLKKNAVYIGILGPKKKYDRMLEDLEARGIHLSEAQQQMIFSPMGLNIGAETPEEIALSIIAEIKLILSGKDGGQLKFLQSSIHADEYSRIQKGNIKTRNVL